MGDKQKHRSTEEQKHKNTKTQKNKSTKKQKHKNILWQSSEQAKTQKNNTKRVFLCFEAKPSVFCVFVSNFKIVR